MTLIFLPPLHILPVGTFFWTRYPFFREISEKLARALVLRFTVIILGKGVFYCIKLVLLTTVGNAKKREKIGQIF